MSTEENAGDNAVGNDEQANDASHGNISPLEFQNIMLTLSALQSVLSSGVALASDENPDGESQDPNVDQIAAVVLGETPVQGDAHYPNLSSFIGPWASVAPIQPICRHALAISDCNQIASVAYCTDCNSLLVYASPKARNRNQAPEKVYPVPRSLLHDKKIVELIHVYSSMCENDNYVQMFALANEKTQQKLFEWRQKYSFIENAPRVSQTGFLLNAVDAFVRTSIENQNFFLAAHRAIMQKAAIQVATAAGQTAPTSVREFLRNTKDLIARAYPEPYFYPQCGGTCTICNEKAVHIRLHSAQQRKVIGRPTTDSLFKTDRYLYGNNGDDASSENGTSMNWGSNIGISKPFGKSSAAPVCCCVEFAVCIDCLLQSYWHSTNSLEKSFSTCPMCRAEYRLEDIIPVYSGKNENSKCKSATSEPVSI